MRSWKDVAGNNKIHARTRTREHLRVLKLAKLKWLLVQTTRPIEATITTLRSLPNRPTVIVGTLRLDQISLSMLNEHRASTRVTILATMGPKEDMQQTTEFTGRRVMPACSNRNSSSGHQALASQRLILVALISSAVFLLHFRLFQQISHCTIRKNTLELHCPPPHKPIIIQVPSTIQAINLMFQQLIRLPMFPNHLATDLSISHLAMDRP